MQQFRTSVSLVTWHDDPDTAQGLVAAINDLLPDDDQASTLATTEYVAEGRPQTTVFPPSEVTP